MYSSNNNNKSDKKRRKLTNNDENNMASSDNDLLNNNNNNVCGDSDVIMDNKFDMLDDDCLRAVLIRCNLTDIVPNLHLTCKRFNNVLNTSIYRRERAIFVNNAIVTGVHIVDPFEQYKEDEEDIKSLGEDEDEEEWRMALSRDDKTFKKNYDDLGYKGEYGIQNCSRFKVFVDNKEIQMTSFNVYLIPRSYDNFFAMCDSIDGQLYQLGVTCFDNNGKPRLKSLKADIPREDERPLLYISDFELPQEYRDDNLKSTIGPSILRTLLTKTLKDRWSVAIYVPDFLPHFTKKERVQWDAANDGRHIDEPLSDEKIQEKKELSHRTNYLTRHDMRQFFRAGFHQVVDPSAIQNLSIFLTVAFSKEISNTSRFDTATTTTTTTTTSTSITTSNHRSIILTKKEALEIEIIELPKDHPSEKTAKEDELFRLMLTKSRERQELANDIDEYRRPLREIPIFKQNFEGLKEAERAIIQCTDNLQKFQEMEEQSEENRLTYETIMDSLPTENKLQEMKHEIEELQRIRGTESVPQEKIDRLTWLEKMVTTNQQCRDEYEEKVQHLEDTDRGIQDNQRKLVECQTQLEAGARKVEDDIQKCCTKILTRKEEELRNFDLDVRRQVLTIVDEESSLTTMTTINPPKDKNSNNRAPTARGSSMLTKGQRSIIKSSAIHACAYNMCKLYVQLLLDMLLPTKNWSDALNSLDSHGSTPLMVCVSSGSLLQREEPKRRELCEFLMSKGADKNVTNQCGLTAYGKFREFRRAILNFEATFQCTRDNTDSDTLKDELELIIMPTYGPSPADEELNSNDDESDMLEDLFDEDDDDDDNDNDNDNDDDDDDDDDGDDESTE